MNNFRGKAMVPKQFVWEHLVPLLATNANFWQMLKFPLRKYFHANNPEKDIPVTQISLRVNEVCNLRCGSCGQWGENGHLRLKLDRGEKLNQLDFDVVKRVMFETRHDKPVYYVWGGEPTMWKPLLPFFQELGKLKQFGSLVTNAQALEPILEDLIDTKALLVLFLSLDGWDSQSQNVMRSSASGKMSDNYEKTMAVIKKTDEIKKRKGLRYPFIVPITVVSNTNYSHLADIHRSVLDTAQLHPYYYGWFITEERSALHEQVFEQRFGSKPHHHRGYLKSCFNDVGAAETARQIAEIKKMSIKGKCAPQFLPDISSEADIARYYNDHTWDCGSPNCESIYFIAEISPDGRVTPCRDYQDYTAGNINTQSFYDIWNGELYKKFRRGMQKGLMPVCTRCCGLQGF